MEPTTKETLPLWKVWLNAWLIELAIGLALFTIGAMVFAFARAADLPLQIAILFALSVPAFLLAWGTFTYLRLRHARNGK
jgi:hypothetical protein